MAQIAWPPQLQQKLKSERREEVTEAEWRLLEQEIVRTRGPLLVGLLGLQALRGVVTFAYITGWRTRSEILPLQWRQVDFKSGTVRLEPGTTKNREGRTFVMTPELRARARGATGEDRGAPAADGADHPLGLPPERAADQVVPPGLALGVQEGRRARPDPA